MRFLAGALVVESLLGVRGVAVAVCGDGIVDSDAYEQCDDGAANGLDACCSTTCQIVDVDGDGQCDARDACHNGTGIRIKDAVLKIGGLATPASDDMIRFAGTLTVPIAPAIDPASSGIRLTMFAPFGDPRGSAVVDLTVPGGPLWRVGPCHVGDPDDLVVCDAENAAHAEVAYFFAHGAFYGGDCTGMPAFVPSPGVACSAAGFGSGYSISTAHPQAYRSCTYVSTASDPLVCS